MNTFTFPARMTLGLRVLALLLMSAAPLQAQRNILRETSEAISQLAEQVIPAVVFIRVEKDVSTGRGMAPSPFLYNDPREFFERFFYGNPQPRRQQPQGRQRQFVQMGQGSGFLISRDGYILTNSHVVGDADRIFVKLADGREFDAKPIGADPKSEIALIKIDGEDLPMLELGDSDALKIGEMVMAVGNPFGLDQTVTTGIVSAKGRSGMGIADYEDFIQTDAAINPGNSGGPLIDVDGHVVGINTAIYSRSGGYMGIGFAVPVNMAKSVKQQLLEDGRVIRGYLGVYIQDVTQELAESFGMEEARAGVLLAAVMPDSAAEKAGLEEGDIVLAINDDPVENMTRFRNKIASFRPGRKINLTVFRGGRERTVPVTIGTMPDEDEVASASGKSIEEKTGLSVQEVTPELARRFGYELDEGVLVAGVENGTAAWRAGLRAGQLITSVNRTAISSLAEYEAAMANVLPSGVVLLRVKEGRGYRFIALQLE